MSTAPSSLTHDSATPTPSVRPSRPFGAHLSMRWWVPVVLTLVVVAATYLLQLLLLGAAALVEVGMFGKDPADTSLTPLTYVAKDLSIILLAPLTLVVLARAARVPWRSALRATGQFRWRRLGAYLGLFAVLMVAVNLALQLVHPSPLSLFAVSGTTVALLVMVLLTTPLQAGAEEVVFRGVLTASYASWVRAARPAAVVGIIGSSTLFAVLHTSADPWMIVNYLGLGASTAVMALLGRGLEAPIAFHVMNNVFSMGIGALFADGGGIGQDRGAGSAGPYMLLFLLAEVVAVLLVWWIERRRST
ncbi:CPBP family intramembrane glutamic endopeptidase [Brachybacterium sp. P6-10-X1]|uniref:CPBP family intramembrane glutamic endopeptidase n=1 Tax=Brachybacterium sp. P6-10-X1 TaxID=1903186 RepID=UPI00155FE548|nr:CPBP family intramembrane glutamic endopeptidase [Brachybacterium sp. P6-10-X1]